jgi:molecular chaperone GrpE
MSDMTDNNDRINEGGPGAADAWSSADDEALRRAAAQESAHPASGGAAYDPSLADDMPAEIELDEEGAAEACAVDADDRLVAAEAEIARYQDALLRSQAEFDNFRKRVRREQEELLSRAAERVVAEMLPALDNLERALAHVREGGDAAQLVKGVEMTHGQILDVLAKEGVVIIDPVGEPFDPTEHQAVGQREDATVADHTVVEVFLCGYRMGSRVVRPASVVVSTGGPASAG